VRYKVVAFLRQKMAMTSMRLVNRIQNHKGMFVLAPRFVLKNIEKTNFTMDLD